MKELNEELQHRTAPVTGGHRSLIDGTRRGPRCSLGKTFVLGRFPTGEALVDACYKVREKGLESIDTHSPYPLHGGDEALGLGRSRVPAHRARRRRSPGCSAAI